ncbi:MAG TPA: hypothetical protein VGO62_17285, partial [Myxococcota bacterium]
MTEQMSAALLRGRALEQSGDVESAYRAYMEGGHLDEAVRMFREHKRVLDAADLIIGWVTRRPRPLSDNDKQWAGRAAELLEEGDAGVRAAEVLAWIGAAAEGNLLAERLQQGGKLADAGAALVRLGDPARGIELLMRTPRGDKRYASSCVDIARGLARGAAITMELDRFLADFIRKGPDDDAEAEALYAIAAAFAREGFPENAIECLKRIEARRPGFKDAGAQAARLEAGARSPVHDFARVLEEDAR